MVLPRSVSTGERRPDAWACAVRRASRARHPRRWVGVRRPVACGSSDGASRSSGRPGRSWSSRLAGRRRRGTERLVERVVEAGRAACCGGSSGSRRPRWASTRWATARTSSAVAWSRPAPAGVGGGGPARAPGRPAGPRPRRPTHSSLAATSRSSSSAAGRVGSPARRPARLARRPSRRADAAGSVSNASRRRTISARAAGSVGCARRPPARSGRAAGGAARPSSGFIDPTSTNRAWWLLRLIPSRSTRLTPDDGHVEQHVDEVVGEQVDLVDVEHAAVGRGQEPRLEAHLAARRARRPGRASRRPAPRWRPSGRSTKGTRGAEHAGQAPRQRRLGRALVAPQEHAAERRLDGGQQQRQLGVVARRRPRRTGSGATAWRRAAHGVLTSRRPAVAPRGPRPPAARRAAWPGPRRWRPTCPARPPRAGARRCPAAPRGSSARRTSRISGSAT